MKYSLEQIDRMRAAISIELFGRGGAWYANKNDQQQHDAIQAQRIEDRLRTYMANGTMPEELEQRLKP